MITSDVTGDTTASSISISRSTTTTSSSVVPPNARDEVWTSAETLPDSFSSKCDGEPDVREGYFAHQSYQTPNRLVHAPAMHSETPQLLDWEQLMSANSVCTPRVFKSPFEYFLGEVLLPPAVAPDTGSAETDKKRQHVYNTMFHVPWRCELLIVTGFFVCLDSFLSLLTVMPVRVLVFLWRLLASKRKYRRLRADELSDLASLLVLAVGVTLLQQADISYIYHMIRSQATVKLYVVYNVLEIFDKLCQSFGSDVLQVVLNSAENVATCTNSALLREAMRFLLDECIAIVSFVFHSFIILAQSITVSAAIRSHNNALLTLLISNNFAEIKSNVFKRLAKDNLHKLAYLDTVERFHIVAHLFFVLAQNFLAAHEPWLNAFAWNAGMVFVCEILVDVIKHAFLAKFNEIKPSAYSEFLLALCKQTLTSQSKEIHKTMSFVPFAPACVVIRVLIPLYAAYLPGEFPWRLVVILFFSILTCVFLVALKILVALGLLKHASWYVTRHKKKEKLLHFD
ncbi:hypothetical protein KP509_31G069900 [Ceratopteris richardii]|uniref:Protein POLLEN DEFECTIVE IN GUIDANCE 1 n=1 Tax=Ceratopteris richardii TaxID=49495 RepID=A0A8T2QZS4_CERRI|nr:hypothetical protein KP509_31G069900 [Ceratopteris richardii]